MLSMMLPLGFAGLIIGISVTAVCMILREIRLLAFEAAMRSGDVETRIT